MTRAIAPLLLALALALPSPAQACGYHDPSSMNLGALNMAYPDSLHVRTAVWMAQRDGELPPREPSPDGDPQAATIRSMMRLGRTVAMLGALRDRMALTIGGRPAPSFSLILIGPMLWARFEPRNGELALQPHADGPAQGDVIVVTDEPVIAALAEERITPQTARRLGLVRLYGDRASVEEVESLLARQAQTTAAPLSHSTRITEAN
jgi:hypothetical protein